MSIDGASTRRLPSLTAHRSSHHSTPPSHRFHRPQSHPTAMSATNRLDISHLCASPTRPWDPATAKPVALSFRDRPASTLALPAAMARPISPSRAPLSPPVSPYTATDKAAQLDDERDGRRQSSMGTLAHLHEAASKSSSSMLPSPSSAALSPRLSSGMQRSTSSGSSMLHSRASSFFSDSLPPVSPFAEETRRREARMRQDQEDILRLRHETAEHYRSVNREPPSLEDAELLKGFIAKVNQTYNDHPGAYLKRAFDSTQQQYSHARKIGPPPAGPPPSVYAPSASSGYEPHAAPPVKRSRPTCSSPLSPPTKRPRTKVPAAAGTDDVTRRRHVRQQARKPKPTPFTTGEAPTAKFWEVQDICPPPSSLPANALQLWSGMKFVAQKYLDLSSDPHVHLLAPAEVELASRLRLPCATYLDAKRRIFLHRRNGMIPERASGRLRFAEFKKTHAQQAVNIDVNKASALHTAFALVGWLDFKWLVPHVAPPVLRAIARVCAAEKALLFAKERKGHEDDVRMKMIWETDEAIDEEMRKRGDVEL